jgi:uncharacterized protein YraI
MNPTESIAARFFSLPFAPLAGVLASLMIADAQARAEEFKPSATISVTNLRTAPRTDSEVLTVIPRGTTIEVGDCRKGWCRVSWNGRDGYAGVRNLDTAAVQRWPKPVAIRPGDDGSSQNSENTREHKPYEHEEGGFPERSFILEIGTAGEWPLTGERPNFGGTIAGEVEPIENWLELELGLTSLATAGRTELSGDLLFKKPFRLSPTAEFMVGLGPSYSRTINGLEQGDSWSVEFALDWMFWPTKNLGWFIEPTWSVNPRNGQQSAAVSIGILVGFPK